MLEVAVALGVLCIGLVSTALLMTSSFASTNQSKYMSLASVLASEKLEDLDRWAFDDPEVAVTSGTTAGSLTSDIVANVTVGAETATVNYYDYISLGASGGAFCETVSGLDAQSHVNYTTTCHSPNGQITVTSASATPALVNFERRWLIEKDTPVVGVKRITVVVTSLDPSIQPPITFQMSLVRP